MSGGFPNNFKTKIETALKRAANHGVMLVRDDKGYVWSLALNRQNKRKIAAIYRDTPHIVIGSYTCTDAAERDRVRAMMIEDCLAIGVEI